MSGASPLGTGDRLPDFTLPDSRGRPQSLTSLAAGHPFVLLAYRGHW